MTASTRPRLLDLFCGAGGAAVGYHQAGFEVIGVDLNHQPRYPFEFHLGDAIEVLTELANGYSFIWPRDWFAAIHASPPCQDHSATRQITGGQGTGWMLAETVARLRSQLVPWVVENVKTASLPRQDDLFGAHGLELCGCMFPELRGQIYEGRLFQTSFPVAQVPHVMHAWRQTKMGRKPVQGECMQVTGHFSDVAEARRRMGTGWMSRDEMAQAIPPAFTEYVGGQLLEALKGRRCVVPG